jgi:molecular chaperone DnaJ
MRSTSVCPQCKGYGKTVDKIPSGADKNGMIKKEETLKIKVPVGVENGNYMTLESQGHEDINRNAGDLYVFFEEQEHEHFTRYGNDVLLQVKVGYSQVVFGDKIDIPTINGHASLKIPSGLQPGQILRIKGKGFSKLGKTSRGDQLVKVQVDVPKNLTKDEKRIIKEYYEIEKDKDIKFEKFED